MKENEDYYRRCIQSIMRDRKQILEEAFEELESEEDLGLPYIISYKAGRRDATDRMWKVFAIIVLSVAVLTGIAYVITLPLEPSTPQPAVAPKRTSEPPRDTQGIPPGIPALPVWTDRPSLVPAPTSGK